MFITPQQIKAARALLEWNQEDLARHARLHVGQVRRFELGQSQSIGILEAIHDALVAQGVVFTRNGGVDLKEGSIHVIEGDGWYTRLLEDVYLTLMDKKDAELLVMFGDDKLSPPEVNGMYRKIRDAGIGMRQLAEEGDTYLMGPVKEYRYVPKNLFSSRVLLIYGDKYAVCAEGNTKAMVFKDAQLAAAQRSVFEIMWKYLEQPERSEASERF